ncbi:unnamed protein product [Parajaminaea phylloscopi]
MFASASSPRRPRAASAGHVLHESAKQNRAQSPSKSKIKAGQASRTVSPRSHDEINMDFCDLLDRFEVTEPTRSKLVSLATVVKEDFLRRESELTAGSFSLFGNSSSSASAPHPARSRPVSPERKSYKGSARRDDDDDDDEPLRPPNRRSLFGQGKLGSSDSSLNLPMGTSGQSRVASGESSRSAPSGASPHKRPRSPKKDGAGSPNLDSGAPFERNERGRGRLGSVASSAIRSLSPTRQAAPSTSSPAQYAKMLLHTSSRKLDIDKLRRLRVLLHSESPSWLGDFLFTHRGYEGMLKRVGELVEMDWREDIHDDKALHELLRGMSSLGATDKGLVALSSLLFRPYLPQLPPSGIQNALNLPETAPASFIGKEDTPPELPAGWELHPPFGPLSGLLLSEKKPGELRTRKLLIDVLALLLSVKLPPGLASVDCFQELREKREVSEFYSAFVASAPLTASPLHLLLLLLHNPVHARSLSLLPFISMSHQPRPFKTYLNELLSVARDYFWIFCHSGSQFWDWQGMGESGRQERAGPSVPGGMTDGVEWEAMGYLTANLNLVNRIASLMPTAGGASQLFHAALFASGMERLLQLLRKASQRYYPAAHLAIAHYLHLARRSGYRLPTSIDMRCEGGLSLKLDCGLPEIPDRTASSSPTALVQSRRPPSAGGESAHKSPLHELRSSTYFGEASTGPSKIEQWPLPPSDASPAREAQAVSPPSNGASGVGTGQWLKRRSTTADDIAAASAFLMTSASDDAFFNAPLGARGQDGEQPRRRGRKSRSLSPARGPQGSANAHVAGASMGASGSRDFAVQALDASTDRSSKMLSAHRRMMPGGEGRGTGERTPGGSGRGPAGVGLVAAGTARDRIKLWEGRAAVGSNGSGASGSRGLVPVGRPA